MAIAAAAAAAVAVLWHPSCANAAPYPILPAASFDIVTVGGAVGDNHTLNTASIARTVDAARRSVESGQHPTAWVVVPKGVFLTGKVELASHVYLVLSPGGVLQGSATQSHYGDDWDYWHVVQGVNLTDTGVIAPEGDVEGIGGGEIVGPMWQMVAAFPPPDFSRGFAHCTWKCPGGGSCGEGRPKNLAFIDCVGVTVRGVRLLDSSDWTQLFRRCHGVVEDHVWVQGDVHWGNNDGLDVESGTNLAFTNSVFITGDDCLAFRSGHCNPVRTPWPLKPPDFRFEPLSGVVVRNVTLTSSSAAVKVEALFQQNHGDVSNMTFTDVRIVHSNRGIGVWQRNGNGALGGLVFDNVDIQTQRVPMGEFWGSGEPIVVTTIPSPCAPSPAAPVYPLRGIHNVTFRNIAAVSEGGALFSCRGQPEAGHLTGVVLDNVSLTIAPPPGDGAAHGLHDYRPVAPCGDGTVPAPVDGIYAEHVADMALRGVSVAFRGGPRAGWSMRCLNATADSRIEGQVAECVGGAGERVGAREALPPPPPPMRRGKAGTKPPHIVYVLSDNLGWGGVGYLRARSPAGPTPEVQTPNIDRLAATGLVLDSFYTWKFCSPSRSSLLSGRHPIHVNVHNDEMFQPGFGIPENMTLIPRKLKELGFSTHHVGKWHCGFSSPSRTPKGRGFDSSLGYLMAANDYLHGLSTEGCENTTHNLWPGLVNFSDPRQDDRRCTARSVNARTIHHVTDLWESGAAGEGPATGINGTAFEEAIFASRVVGIIDGHDPKTPLFVYYPMHLLHSPLCAPNDYIDRFSFIKGNEDRRYVAAMTAFMDDAVGDVVDALNRSGMWDDTVFVWSSDNGAAIELDTGAKTAYPLKGGYCVDWEGGVRAPAVVNGGRLPDRQRGRTLTGLVHISDWWPTFVVGLAGGNASDPTAAAAALPPVDGIDMWPYLSGVLAESPRREVGFTPINFNETAHRPSNGSRTGNDSAIIVVVGGAKLKLITGAAAQASWVGPAYPNGSRPETAPLGECAPGEDACWDTWATVEQCTVPPGCASLLVDGAPGAGCKLGCVYNLTADPTEHVDLAESRPELARLLFERLRAYSATLWDPHRGELDPEGACAAAARNGGFFGPWLANGDAPV